MKKRCLQIGDGHTVGLTNLFPHASVYAVDQDPDAVKNGEERIINEGLENKNYFDQNQLRAISWVSKNQPDLSFQKSNGFGCFFTPI